MHFLRRDNWHDRCERAECLIDRNNTPLSELDVVIFSFECGICYKRVLWKILKERKRERENKNRNTGISPVVDVDLSKPNLNRCQVRTRFFDVQVQGSQDGTDIIKVIKCANTVIMLAQVQQLSHCRLRSDISTSRAESKYPEVTRDRCSIIGLITLGH